MLPSGDVGYHEDEERADNDESREPSDADFGDNGPDQGAPCRVAPSMTSLHEPSSLFGICVLFRIGAVHGRT